ncbi:MAG: metal-dependent transcriptional regulator [Anaerolineae bacterium]|nr:metal-dependent transcriptional regulator [Anaerolineae bacterium]
MLLERAEEYLAGIYRLRTDTETPLPLAQLTEYFNFSPVSVHEMVVKLSNQGWTIYHPYQGVTLTANGEAIAVALVRRHRLWERFLTDKLEIPWEEAHEIAERLEHAASEQVTERLASFLGEPERCPHGEPIPPQPKAAMDQAIAEFPAGAQGEVTRISPESTELLQQVQQWGLRPGASFQITEQTPTTTTLIVDDRVIQASHQDTRAIWAKTTEG